MSAYPTRSNHFSGSQAAEARYYNRSNHFSGSAAQAATTRRFSTRSGYP